MEPAKLAQLRTALQERRDQLRADIDHMGQEMRWLSDEQANEAGSVGNHLAEDGSSVMEQERIGTVSQDLKDVLQQVEGALTKIDNGSYGSCERCRRPINEERLEALPYTRYCIECQSTLERQQSLYGATIGVS